MIIKPEHISSSMRRRLLEIVAQSVQDRNY
jgi:hypothetical protein